MKGLKCHGMPVAMGRETLIAVCIQYKYSNKVILSIAYQKHINNNKKGKYYLQNDKIENVFQKLYLKKVLLLIMTESLRSKTKIFPLQMLQIKYFYVLVSQCLPCCPGHMTLFA